MKLNKAVLTATLAAACGVSGALPAHAGGDKVGFPTGFEKGTLYSVLDRHDNKQYRELFASPGVVDAVRKGMGVPDGAVLTLCNIRPKRMKNGFRPGTQMDASSKAI